MREMLVLFGLLEPARQARKTLHRLQRRILQSVFPKGKFVTISSGKSGRTRKLHVSFASQIFRWYTHRGSRRYQDSEYEFFSQLFSLQEPKIVFDVGAHWGIYPVLMSMDSRASAIERVICFEPDAQQVFHLRKTVGKISNLDVSVFEAALGDVDGPVAAYRGQGECLQTYSWGEAAPEGTVRMVRIDTAIRELGVDADSVTHIKLDIDGFEPDFFLGNAPWLAKHRPLIVSEFWPEGLLQQDPARVDDYFKFITAHYTISIWDRRTGALVSIGLDGLRSKLADENGQLTELVMIPQEQVNKTTGSALFR